VNQLQLNADGTRLRKNFLTTAD